MSAPLAFDPTKWDKTKLTFSEEQRKHNAKDKNDLLNVLSELCHFTTDSSRATECATTTTEINADSTLAVDDENHLAFLHNLALTGGDVKSYAADGIDLSIDVQYRRVMRGAHSLLAYYHAQHPAEPQQTKKQKAAKNTTKPKTTEGDSTKKKVDAPHTHSKAFRILCKSMDTSPTATTIAKSQPHERKVGDVTKTDYRTSSLWRLANSAGATTMFSQAIAGAQVAAYRVASVSQSVPFLLYLDNTTTSVTQGADVLKLLMGDAWYNTTTQAKWATVSSFLTDLQPDNIEHQNTVALITHKIWPTVFADLLENVGHTSSLKSIVEFTAKNAMYDAWETSADKIEKAEQLLLNPVEMVINNKDASEEQVKKLPRYVQKLHKAHKTINKDQDVILPFLHRFLTRIAWRAQNIVANNMGMKDVDTLGVPVALLNQTKRSRDEQNVIAFIDEKLKKHGDSAYRTSGIGKKVMAKGCKGEYYNWKKNCLGKKHVKELLLKKLEFLDKQWANNRQVHDLLVAAFKADEFKTIKSLASNNNTAKTFIDKMMKA